MHLISLAFLVGAAVTAAPQDAAEPALQAVPEAETAPEAAPDPQAEPAPAPAPEASSEKSGRRTRILALALKTESVGQEVASILDGAVATSLSRYPQLDVVTQTDLAQLMELEAERAAAGCDESGCLAEIAGALGADLVIYGRVAQLDEIYVLQLFLFDASQATAVARQQRTSTKVSTLANEVEPAVEELVGKLLGEGAVADDEPAPAEQNVVREAGGDEGRSLLSWGLMGGGGAVLAAGLVGGLGAIVALGSGAFLFYGLDKREGDARQLGQNLARGAAVAGAAALVILAGGAALAGVGVLVE